MNEMVISVLLVDDDAMVRQLLASYLQSVADIEVKGICPDGAQALDFLAQTPVDVVLADVRMPVMDGAELTRRIVKLGTGAVVLALTTLDEDDAMREILRAGAKGFLLKDMTPEELVNAIRAVKSGATLIAPGPATRMISSFPESAASSMRVNGDHLTERESDVLALLCQGLGNREIARELGITESTVKSHLAALTRKLHATSRLQLVVKAHQLGLV